MISNDQIKQLTGRTVELVCFAQFTMYIHLSGGAMLTVEGGFQHIHENTRCDHEAGLPLTESRILTILESSVSTVNIQTNGDLHLALSNGDSIAILKDPGFESYRLRIGD